MTDELQDWVSEQRWFGAKARDLAALNVLEITRLPGGLEIVIVEARFPTGTHELYQLVARGEERDALEDPAAAQELLALIVGGEDQSCLQFRWVGEQRPSGQPTVRSVGVEQSNTSIVFDDSLILKVFRRLEPGDNPELEILRFLGDRGFAHIAPLAGWYEHEGRLIDATLGVVQQFLPSGRDGWELALNAIREGEDFTQRARDLGGVTGELHSALAADASDPHFAPEEPSEEGLALLVATVDEEIERLFVDLPDGDDAVAPIAGRGQDLRELLNQLAHAGPGGRLIRTHGDYHLGQTLLTDEGWVMLDFEGEPARSLPERRRKRNPLRDVAGMLRSFAYAADTAGQGTPQGWEDSVREAFLAGYHETVDSILLPPGAAAEAKLLAVFELEKAVYELRYELNNRPDWVHVPVAGIRRILEEGWST